MKTNRRNFISTAVGGLSVSLLPSVAYAAETKPTESMLDIKSRYIKLDEVIKQPVLKKELFPSPVIVETLELLHYDGNFLCRVRSSDSSEGTSVGHPFQQRFLNPIFKKLKPFFLGKDVRELELLIEEVYQANYKLQGLALWIPLATIEFAILDMLGHIRNKSIGQLIGEIYNPKVTVYHPNNNRGLSAEESIERIQKNIKDSNAKAIKIKLGGRMNLPDSPSGRSEKLIPLVRKTFGDNMILYADANSSFTVDEAITIGKLLEENNYGFFEEPVPYDKFDETRQVAQALSIPISGGEQETSLNHFRWLIANDALQIVQPDQFYFGGIIRSMKVARMAEVLGKVCTPHLSGGGLGYLYMMHFVSAIPNPGPHHEVYRDNASVPVESQTSSLIPDENGEIKVPTGPGLGVVIDPEFVAKHQVVKM